MKNYKLLLIILLGSILVCTKCGKNTSDNGFSFDESQFRKKFFVSDVAKLSVLNADNKTVDSIVFYINDVKIGSQKGINSFNFSLKNQKLGYQNLKSNIYFDGETVAQTVVSKLEIVSSVTPKLLKFEIVNTYPHDTTSFTEGLEFYNGILYENTGEKGKSRLLKTDFKTGKILKSVPMETQYFGEGITVISDKIYQLTWQDQIGFIYDARSMVFQKTFKYDKQIEGWGMTNDGKNIYQSDGTEKIWTMDPDTQKLLSYINVYSGSEKIKSVNELEWVDGKIYANIWQKDAVAVVNPASGAVENIINLAKLRKLTKATPEDTLNGIAYNPSTKTFFVTGKNWDKMFEIRILNK